MPYMEYNPDDYIAIPQQDDKLCTGCAFCDALGCAVMYDNRFMCMDIEDGSNTIYIKKEA